MDKSSIAIGSCPVLLWLALPLAVFARAAQSLCESLDELAKRLDDPRRAIDPVWLRIRRTLTNATINRGLSMLSAAINFYTRASASSNPQRTKALSTRRRTRSCTGKMAASLSAATS